MIGFQADGRSIKANPGETLLTALRREGIHIPTLCHMEDMLPSGACRLCIVEVEGSGALVPACSYPVAADMAIHTRSPRVLEARKTIVELLLANHPDDCLYCSRSGKCDLQSLSVQLDVRQRAFPALPGPQQVELDMSSPSLVRDPAKCILCGRCVRVCEEVQGVSAIDFMGRGARTKIGTAFDQGLNLSSCINCGQCILVCPTGALTEQSSLDEVVAALADAGKVVVAQHAPAVSVSLAEEIGLKAGTDVDGLMVAALRHMGFDYVFDTSFAADLTIMEEGSELVERIRSGGALPMMTSCSPGWIKYVETFYPEFIPNLSTCKSPQQMMGAVIKNYWAERQGIDPEKVVSVSIMPCTAKKFECSRPEMGNELRDVDYVLTTRELGQLIRMFGVELQGLEPQLADNPFGERSSAGKIFGASGGVMEAAIRSVHYLLTGREMEDVRIQPARGMKGVKELRATVDGLEVGACVVSGLGNARDLLEQLRAGRDDLHFIEVMTCPGGCINGGGQPIGADLARIRSRMEALYRIDREDTLQVSHKNPWVLRLYEEFLGKPLGHESHRLLHTHYDKREAPV
ncbi:MAG TPA: NADH-dependent [FeFe] hydrogenase, group A6 [Longimicrobiales bacterium]|nr:NADH-dependent [FeFe] hydrogenase, group A6 [Longimicrobiales bacterium]